jgi:hypothetical protein
VSRLLPPEPVTAESLRAAIARDEAKGDERGAELGRAALRRLLKLAPARRVPGLVVVQAPLAPLPPPRVSHERFPSALAFQALRAGGDAR